MRPPVSVRRPASTYRLAACILIAIGIAVMLPGELMAQGCAMCGTYIGKEDPIAKGMNASVLFLMSMPFVMAGSIGTFFIYMHRRAHRARRLFHVLSAQKEELP